MAGVVGRGAEQSLVTELLEDDGARMQAVVIEGEAGIGKSTLWRDGVARARDMPLTTLTAQPAEAESTLPFSALGDLLQPVLDERLPGIPPALRIPLEIALQRRTATEPPEHLAVSRATVELLSLDGPLLLAVDDVQWIDPPSERVLEFALRRLTDAPIRVLLTRRSEQVLPAPLGLDRALQHGGFRSQRLGPMTLGELSDLLSQRCGLRLPRPQLVRLRKVSGGNPLFALEIARTATGSDFRVPPHLTAALEERLASLPPAGREAALIAAAAGRPTSTLVERAAGSSDGLAAAIEADVLSLAGDRIRFTHPLLASVAYDSAPPWERREAHRRLAEVASGEERALNLARATDTPDEAVALELEEAAESVAARGAPSSSASLLEDAARVTPESESADRRRRMLAAAEQHFYAGDHDRSRELLEPLVEDVPAGPDRARILARLSQVAANEAEGLALCRQALEESGGDRALEAELHHRIAASLRRLVTVQEAEEHARQAVDLTDEVDNPVQLARALAMLGSLEYERGSPEGLMTLQRAAAIEAATDGFPLRYRPSFLLGWDLLHEGELDRARPLIEAQRDRASAAGDEIIRAICLASLAGLELRAGDWGLAHRLSVEALALLAQAAPAQDQAYHATEPGYVFAHIGKLDDAREIAKRILEEARASDSETAAMRGHGLLSFVELSVGDARRAVESAAPAVTHAGEIGLGALTLLRLFDNFVFALVSAGELDRAERVNALVAGGASARSVAIHARGAAQTAAARGGAADADRAIARALEAHEDWHEPFELGRTLLVRGRIERRFKRRSAARDALGEALELFDGLGAPLWAEQATAELARVPGRSRATGELTETERRVAELVAEGLSNKEVAARLFVTVRTVEANLTKVYAKLGIRSRTELANTLHE
jgi:DNA-binding CsgD family transcriptional regulator